jgi:hypothetical protein
MMAMFSSSIFINGQFSWRNKKILVEHDGSVKQNLNN